VSIDPRFERAVTAQLVLRERRRRPDGETLTALLLLPNLEVAR
jgi:hypothetical protein